MNFKQKTQDFIARHGWTWRSYVLSILFFPPAAVYIACRKPGVPLAGRVALNVMAVTAPPLVSAGTLLLLKTAFELLHG